MLQENQKKSNKNGKKSEKKFSEYFILILLLSYYFKSNLFLVAFSHNIKRSTPNKKNKNPTFSKNNPFDKS